VQGAQVVDLAGVVEVTPQITFAIGVALSLVMALVAFLLLKNPGRAEHV